MHQGLFDASNREMVAIVTKVQGNNAGFVICEVHGPYLVYHKTCTGDLQLVLPKSHRLHLHVALDLHGSLHSVHLSVRKTTAALQHHFWWPKLPKHITVFVKACTICQCIKDINALQAGLL